MRLLNFKFKIINYKVLYIIYCNYPYLSRHSYTPNLSLYGDMGWIPCSIKQWSCVFRNWSRLTKMCDDRLNKNGFFFYGVIHTERVE